MNTQYIIASYTSLDPSPAEDIIRSAWASYMSSAGKKLAVSQKNAIISDFGSDCTTTEQIMRAMRKQMRNLEEDQWGKIWKKMDPFVQSISTLNKIVGSAVQARRAHVFVWILY